MTAPSAMRPIADRPIRALVVDDSRTMRAMIARMLASDPGIEIVGEAADAREARQRIKQLDPDVVTLDIEMPGMSGLEFLEKIMTLRPMPVVIVSAATEKDADVTLQALEMGAFDCYLKPRSGQKDMGELAALVRSAAGSVQHARVARAATAPAAPAYRFHPDGLIAIGSSTGGVEALLETIGGFPADCPPTVIVQHMPAMFTGSFAARLDRFCAPTVAEATSGTLLKPGHVYLAPGGDYHLEVIGQAAPRCRLTPGATVSGHRPSVDMLFRSVAKLGRPAVGVILTGMGQDGAAGLLEMRQAGARTVGQDEATSVVYGMPGVAHAIGAVEHQLPLPQVAAKALELSQR